jgi:hypothetical protein
MNQQEFEKLAGMMAKIAYEVHDKEGIDEGLREMLLDLWREFNHYTYSND